MSENKENNITYYPVPSNVSTKFEFFPGFGWFEFKYVVIALAIGGLLFFLSGLISKTTYIEPSNLTFEQKVGLDETELKGNSDGLIEIKKQIVPIIVRIFFIVIPVAGTFFFVKREPSSNMSLINNLRGASEFKKNQRLYLYKYNSGSEV